LNAQVKNEKSKQESVQAKASLDTSKLHQIEHRKLTGKCKFCGMPLNLSAKEKMKYEVMYPYSCPMSHDPKTAKESKCPKCGKKIKKVNPKISRN
jgi:Zn finger protein HypA/HybF involved in hydrogenase expression